MKNSQVVPLAILIGGVIIAAAVYFSVTAGKPSPGLSLGDPSLVRPVDSSDHILGNPSAPVKIIEYSDFDCEFCKDYDATLHQIVALEGARGQVAWVYREFPLVPIHKNAYSHAQAAECAAQVGGNNAFWTFADSLFAHQPTDPSQYGTLANAAHLNGSEFATCFQNAKSTVDARIDADVQNAKDSGASGTPYTILVAPGKTPVVISAAYPYDEVKNIVQQMLAQ